MGNRQIGTIPWRCWSRVCRGFLVLYISPFLGGRKCITASFPRSKSGVPRTLQLTSLDSADPTVKSELGGFVLAVVQCNLHGGYSGVVHLRTFKARHGSKLKCVTSHKERTLSGATSMLCLRSHVPSAVGCVFLPKESREMEYKGWVHGLWLDSDNLTT